MEPEVHYRVYKSPPPVSILSRISPLHALPSHFLKVHLNIILPSTSWSPQWSLSLGFPHQNLVHTSPLLHTCHDYIILVKILINQEINTNSPEVLFLHTRNTVINLNLFNVFSSKITRHIEGRSDLPELQSFSVDWKHLFYCLYESINWVRSGVEHRTVRDTLIEGSHVGVFLASNDLEMNIYVWF